MRRHNEPGVFGADVQHYQYVTLQDILDFEWEAAEIFPAPSSSSEDAPRAAYVLDLSSATVLLDTFTDRRLFEHLTWEVESNGLRPSFKIESPGFVCPIPFRDEKVLANLPVLHAWAGTTSTSGVPHSWTNRPDGRRTTDAFWRDF